MTNYINNPDVIPNNFKLIREMKGKSRIEAAEILGIKYSKLASIETNRVNINDILVSKILLKFDISFYQLYSQQKKDYLKCTEKLVEDFKICVQSTSKVREICNLLEILIKFINNYNSNGVTFKARQEVCNVNQNSNEQINIFVESKKVRSNLILFDLDLTLNFDTVLFEILIRKGFYKEELEEIDLYNIEFIKDYLGQSDEYICDSLGISMEKYLEICNGKTRLTSNLMWKLTNLFNVPLECIINIPLYWEIFG